MFLSSQIHANLNAVRASIAAACERSGRPRESVTLIAVTKYAELDWMRALYDQGIRDFGESRPQQLAERRPLFPGDVRWHLIGHLQRNKARKVLPLAHRIHSVDTVRLLDAVDRLGEELSLRPDVLLEVNVSGESAKDGFSPAALLAQWNAVAGFTHLRLRGLMTMAPLTDDPEHARPVFRRLRELRDELQAGAPPHVHLNELSMGMSGDFEVAIEEGATMVRVGSRLFDGLS